MRTRRARRHALCAFLIGTLILVGSCAPHRGAPGSPTQIDRLYFGRNVADTLAVTDSAWTAFLAEVVTPRFPDGLTAWRAEGQWRNPEGVIEREPSFVLELVHPPGGEAERSLTEIIAEYKRRFHQQSVLRVMEDGRAGF